MKKVVLLVVTSVICLFGFSQVAEVDVGINVEEVESRKSEMEKERSKAWLMAANESRLPCVDLLDDVHVRR